MPRMYLVAVPSDMTAWKLDIAREFVGNRKETPLQGVTIQDANGGISSFSAGSC